LRASILATLPIDNHMQVARLIRSYIIGKDQFINSRAEFKRVMFTGYLSLLSIVANLAYIVLGVQERYWLNLLMNTTFCLVCLVCLTLIRLRKYTSAKLLLFASAYIIIFVFCALEPFHTGVYIFLIIICIGSFALFGFEERRYSIGLSICGALLFSVAYIVGFKLSEQNYSLEYIYNNFILNFFVALFTAISILYFLIDLHHYSELSLEKKEAEALERNNELTKLNNELDRFVYSVSHDLRSPLSTILGLVNIGKYAEDLSEAKKYFAMIDDRLKAQDFFIHEIIDYYRNTRTEIQPESFLLKEHIHEIVKEFSHHAAPTTIEYQVEISPDLEIQSDRIRLRSVVSNLVGNAIKYHDNRKSQPYVKISAERRNDYVEILVEDNGLGIGQEHLPKVFDMFYRASADSKGSGLGLFIAKETIGKMGGKIQVDSKLGEGSKFSFTISA